MGIHTEAIKGVKYTTIILYVRDAVSKPWAVSYLDSLH